MPCPSCGHDNRAGARFCDSCGAPQSPACSECGTELRSEARFCDSCGTPVAAAAGAASPAAPAPERTPRQYTPQHLSERILQSRAAMEGERKQVTVLFADVQGSMALAEEVGAEGWHRILDRLFEILSEGVHRFEGTINQFTGDGIMALFGAPIAHEDHAQRACLTALHLRDALREFADELRRTQGISLATRVGLNSGEVIVGKIGDDLRMDYTAQGHTVGLAQRMEQRAGPDSCYLTEHTARLVEGYFDLRSLGDFEIKGVERPVPVFSLEGLGEIRTRLDRSRARGFSRFVGRGEEVEILEAALDRAIAGQGSAVGVVAQAGVGKSRLCMEFAQATRARGVAVYEAHCPSHGQAVPLLPILELFRSFFGIQRDDDPQAAREKITGRLLVLDRELEPMLPLALDVLGVADPAAPPLVIDPKDRQREVVTLARRLLYARSQREPAVLLVDDVHWIDPASDAFMASLASTITGTRTLLLLNFRPEYQGEWLTGSAYQQIALHPLGDAALDSLLADLLGSDPSLAPLTALVRERSGGNPFFVEEIVQELVESGSLAGERGARRLVASADRIDVPPTVQAVLGARVDRLPEREKHLLQTAAVIGRSFREPLLRKVASLGEDELGDALRALVRAEFIHEQALYPEAEYLFRHPLTHEVAERSLLADRRRAVHAAVARELEEQHGHNPGEQSALLAHHWDAAGETKPAALWHRRAAEWIAGSQPGEASRHWQRVRELADELEARAGENAAASGRAEGGAPDPQDAELAAELGERSRLMVLEYSWRIGASEAETDALLAEGEAWARAHRDEHARAKLLNAYAMPAVLVHGRTRKANDTVEEALRLTAGSDDRGVVFALELRGFLCAEFLGNVPEMHTRIARMMAFAPAEMDAANPIVGYDARALGTGYQGSPLLYGGDPRAGLDYFAEGIALAQRSGSIEVVSWLRSYEAMAWTALGDFERAVALCQEGLEIAERIESPLSTAIVRHFMTTPLLELGQIDEARASAEEAVKCGAITARTSETEALSALAQVELRAGRLELAREIAERACAQAEERDFQRMLSVALRSRANVAVAEGDLEAAEADVVRAEALVREGGFETTTPWLLWTRSEIHRAAGREAAATETLQRLLALYRGMGAEGWVARVEERLGAPAQAGP